MRSKRKSANVPVRWQPYAELTAAACGGAGEGSIPDTSLLLGGGNRDGIVERNLLSLFQGEANQQKVTYDRAEASVALSLRVGSQEKPPPQPQNRRQHAATRQSPSLRRACSSVPPPQTYAPGSWPAGAGAGLAPPQLGNNNSPGAGLAPPQLGNNNSLQQLSLGATPPEPPRSSLCYDGVAADLLKVVSADLDRRVGLLRQELGAEVRKEVLRLHAAAAAAGAGVPRPQSARPATASFSAAGLPQTQPCGGGGGAWRWCPACRARPGTVVLEPYEHLCLCAQCSADASRVCLVCSFTWTGGAVEAAASRGRGRGRGREGSLPPLPW